MKRDLNLWVSQNRIEAERRSIYFGLLLYLLEQVGLVKLCAYV